MGHSKPSAEELLVEPPEFMEQLELKLWLPILMFWQIIILEFIHICHGPKTTEECFLSTTVLRQSLIVFYLRQSVWEIEKRTLKDVELVEADYLLIAGGSSPQGHSIAVQLGHSIIDPVGPMLVTHWGLSGPAILRLSAWGKLIVDFVPDLHIEDLKSVLSQQKNRFLKQKVLNSSPVDLRLVKRFWKYILGREGLMGDTLWASVSNNSIVSIANLLKHCTFEVKGKGQFKDGFVTAGGVPLSGIHLNTMESRIQPNLYLAGEAVLALMNLKLNCRFRVLMHGNRVKLRNAWSGGYIAGSSSGRVAGNANLEGAM
ncbi:hypothetical protein F3Y22_tig00005406pilonHSYRG00011 [Hibiscus syriacus]|uniref:RsdA/BaiN/AoA(So)-like insert domain-containing protein n=1 Tax=Hibiscus syriacus TaxID=106335 RepID=A0A6A3CK52_HIBSY|nr:hypothetical protein F3Y22_tig00005406pilonHSYRG00011 [Hibiscus syriacus]